VSIFYYCYGASHPKRIFIRIPPDDDYDIQTRGFSRWLRRHKM
jgi:hypothetical protein